MLCWSVSYTHDEAEMQALKCMQNTAAVFQWNLMRQNHSVWVCSFLPLTDVASVNSAVVMTTGACVKRILCFRCNILCAIHCFLWLGFYCEYTDASLKLCDIFWPVCQTAVYHIRRGNKCPLQKLLVKTWQWGRSQFPITCINSLQNDTVLEHYVSCFNRYFDIFTERKKTA